MNKLAVWALLVVSSEQQSETLAHQRRWAEETAKTKGWRIARFIDGVGSGKAGPRRLLTEMIADLRELEPEARPAFVLMIRLDRVGRGSISDSQVVLHDLKKLGVGVWTRDAGELKLDSAMDELIAAAQLAVARHENDVRAEKMRNVYRRKRAAGEVIGNRRPYGVKRGDDGRDAPDGRAARVVREAFKMRCAGAGYHVIGLRLAEIAPPQTFKHGLREIVIRWTQNRVKRLLENRAYVGVVVDEATFARAQQIGRAATADRSRDERRRWPWPLTGALTCYCGRGMAGIACGARERRIRYYACRATWNHEGSLRLVRADDLEKQFVALLERLVATPDLISRHRRAAAGSPRMIERAIRENETALADVNRKRDRVWDLHDAGKVRADDMQERLDALNAQRDEIAARISQAKESLALAKAAAGATADAEAVIRNAARIFSRAPESNQREIARNVAVEVGGFQVTPQGKVKVGRAVDPEAQRAG